MDNKYISNTSYDFGEIVRPTVMIDPEQLNLLVSKIGDTDWIAVLVQSIVQILAVALAAYAAYKYEAVLRKRDENSTRRAAALKFNEATVHLASFHEALCNHLEQLVLKNFEKEQKFRQLLEKRDWVPIVPKISFGSIRPVKLHDMSSFLSKIPDLGEHNEIITIYSRLNNEVEQFTTICTEREYLIKKLFESRDSKGTLEFSPFMCDEIFQTTRNLLVSGVSILDSALYIAKLIEPLQTEIKDKLKKDKIHGIKIMRIKKNEHIESFYYKLNDLIDDNLPEYSDRLLSYEKKSTKI